MLCLGMTVRLCRLCFILKFGVHVAVDSDQNLRASRQGKNIPAALRKSSVRENDEQAEEYSRGLRGSKLYCFRLRRRRSLFCCEVVAH
jgi:hypothetical protein